MKRGATTSGNTEAARRKTDDDTFVSVSSAGGAASASARAAAEEAVARADAREAAKEAIARATARAASAPPLQPPVFPTFPKAAAAASAESPHPAPHSIAALAAAAANAAAEAAVMATAATTTTTTSTGDAASATAEETRANASSFIQQQDLVNTFVSLARTGPQWRIHELLKNPNLDKNGVSSRSGLTALESAARSGKLGNLRLISKHSKAGINRACYLAMIGGHESCVEELITIGVDVNEIIEGKSLMAHFKERYEENHYLTVLLKAKSSEEPSPVTDVARIAAAAAKAAAEAAGAATTTTTLATGGAAGVTIPEALPPLPAPPPPPTFDAAAAAKAAAEAAGAATTTTTTTTTGGAASAAAVSHQDELLKSFAQGIKSGDVDKVKAALDQGLDVMRVVKFKSYNTNPLIITLSSNQPHILKLVLENNPYTKGDITSTEIHLYHKNLLSAAYSSCEKGYLKQAVLLLKNCRFNLVDPNHAKYTEMMHNAARYMDDAYATITFIKLLHDTHGVPYDCKLDGKPLLDTAIKANNRPAVSVILSLYAKNRKDPKNLLIAPACDDGRSLITYVASKPEMIDVLRVIIRYCVENNPRLIELNDSLGSNALHTATINKNYQAVYSLIVDGGVNPSHLNILGQSASILAGSDKEMPECIDGALKARKLQAEIRLQNYKLQQINASQYLACAPLPDKQSQSAPAAKVDTRQQVITQYLKPTATKPQQRGIDSYFRTSGTGGGASTERQ